MGDLDLQMRVWFLRRLNLHASLTEEEVEQVAQQLDDRFVPSGTQILDRRWPDQVYLVKQGAVRLYDGGPRQEVTLALLGPGRMFGVSSDIGTVAPTVNAVTMVPSYVCFTTWGALMAALAKHPEALLQVVQWLADQVYRSETWLERFGIASPRARLAGLLIELVDEFGEPTPTGPRIRFPLSRADLAGMIGVSRETASRLMAEFGRAEWVVGDGGLLVVRNRAALGECARGHHVKAGNAVPDATGGQRLPGEGSSTGT